MPIMKRDDLPTAEERYLFDVWIALDAFVDRQHSEADRFAVVFRNKNRAARLRAEPGALADGGHPALTLSDPHSETPEQFGPGDRQVYTSVDPAKAATHIHDLLNPPSGLP